MTLARDINDELAQLHADFQAEGIEPTPQLIIWSLAAIVAQMRRQRSSGFARLPYTDELAIAPKQRMEPL